MNMELIAKYGQPEHFDEALAIVMLGLLDVTPAQVYASKYPSREAAEAFQAANLEHHGHPSLGIAEHGGGFIGVLDIRPAIARARAEAGAERARRKHYPYKDGDITVLGPEVLASASGDTICWRGVNYRREGSLAPGGTDHDERDTTT